MGNGNKVEMLIAICAVITSAVAVFIAWDQATVMRSQERATVWPMIQMTHQTDRSGDSDPYTFHIQNAGVGPAFIDTYLIRIPGQDDTKDFARMVDYFLYDMPGPAEVATGTLDGRFLRQGDELMPIRATWRSSPEIATLIQERVNEFVEGERLPAEVFVCYCSILDDCWVAATIESSPRPIEVKSCKSLSAEADRLMPLSPSEPEPKVQTP